MKSFSQYITEKKTTNIEVKTTAPDDAQTIFQAAMENMGINFEKEFPNFKQNYVMVRDKISYARYLRKQMPVVKSEDLDKFKKWLRKEHGVKTVKAKIKPTQMFPIQKQLYIDNPIKNIKAHGLKQTLTFIRQKSHAITSMDNYIMDGNHRFLLGALHDPNKPLQTYLVQMKAEELYAAMNYFTDNVVKRARNEQVWP